MTPHPPSSLTLELPRAFFLPPLLYSLYKHDCVATFDSNTIVKFADDTVVVGLITDNNEIAFLKEVEGLTHWCQDSKTLMNISKKG